MRFIILNYRKIAPNHCVFLSCDIVDSAFRRRFESKWSVCFKRVLQGKVRGSYINNHLSIEENRQVIRDKIISESTVTLVLVGENTWRNKSVDWEISSSIHDTKNNPKTGLLGVLLPSYKVPNSNKTLKVDLKRTEDGVLYNPYTIPPRLQDNLDSGYAKIYSWPKSVSELEAWVHDAFLRRSPSAPATNARSCFVRNRSELQRCWKK